ncbi:SDR family oxidoreductase [Phytomonospora sp. NPDC050363]|uniref:SDR family NAD(P)-dependent oxidoreductase n=1 Tax=Phytomonospora sp. NPDC050363 TaxID=3155642 RepID=UPI0033F42D92
MSDRPLAFVTGAASGIGYATALRLARAGYGITAADVDAVGLQRTAHAIEEAGGSATVHAFDIRDDTALAAVLDETGTPAVLANIAGVGVAAPLADTSTEDWDRIISINLTAVFTTCRAVIPRMLEAGGGNIVNVGSVAGVVGVANRAAYCASKGGVISLTRSIAADYAAKGIRANAICPGTVASEWIGKILADAPDPEATRRAMEARQLDGRMGSPDEVAAGIAFLVSEDGRFVNGTAFVMDGGMTSV